MLIHQNPLSVLGIVMGIDGVTMARVINKLTAKGTEKETTPGRHTDGGGLYLDVSPSKAKSWVFLYRSPAHRIVRNGKTVGKQREMGLGAYGTDTDKVSLATARELAEAARKLIKDSKDPLDERNREAVPVARVPTFGEMADQVIKAMATSWRNEKHRAQWEMTLKEYAAPLRGKPVNEIGVDDVLACLKPHWEQRPETAGRLRGRIERVLNAAKAQGHRTGENPAAWRGHLENLLPGRQRLARGHHAAMPWASVPAFLDALRKREGAAALALEFTVLTAVRSGEARGTRWDEIDAAAKVWTIPAKRMKAGKEHHVPLTDRALAILEAIKPLRTDSGLVFPGFKAGAPLSDMTMKAVLNRMKVTTTVHGFRSSFRDWCGDTTSFPREIAEAALAHTVGSKVEVTYRRGDALEKRRQLMQAWTDYCTGVSAGNVITMRKAR
jgi:integrase